MCFLYFLTPFFLFVYFVLFKFVLILFYCSSIAACFPTRDRKGVALDERGGRKKLRGDGKGKTIIRM